VKWVLGHSSWPFFLYPGHPEYKATVEHAMGLWGTSDCVMRKGVGRRRLRALIIPLA